MKTRENVLWQGVGHVILMLLAVMCLMPIILLVMSSFTDERTILRDGYSFVPAHFSLEAYVYLMNKGNEIFRAYGVSILITVVGTLSSLVLTALLAYPLSRPDMPARSTLMFVVFFTMLFNGGLVPTYLVYTQLFDIKNTLWALIVPGLLMNGFNVLLMRTFFKTSIPPALIESASIDGAGEWRTLWSVVLPLSKPIIATIGLFQTIHYWNDWMNGMIYITDSRLFSLQNLLNRVLQDVQFLASGGLDSMSNEMMATLPSETVKMAIAAVGALPLLLAYPFFQKFLVKGIVIGAVKG